MRPSPAAQALVAPRPQRWALAWAAAAALLPAARAGMCPGSFQLPGHGAVALTNAGADTPGKASHTELQPGGTVVAHMDARTYFADSCEGTYSNTKYSAMKLLGKVLRYTTDVSGAGCGCNAAFYLVSMRQNSQISTCNDYYCDANKVCGVACAEVDIQEASKRAWHSTLHGASDSSGMGGGYGGGSGWNGPRDFTSAQYGPGAACIDTTRPFEVAVSFPKNPQGQLQAMQVTLTQQGKNCPLTVNLGSYANMGEISAAIAAGMTPVISYWKSGDMLWMDGKGADGQGPCAADSQRCGESVKFSNFTVEYLPGQGPVPRPQPAVVSQPARQPHWTAVPAPAPASPRPAPGPAPVPAAGGGGEEGYKTVVVQVPASELPADMRFGGEVGLKVGGHKVQAELIDVRPPKGATPTAKGATPTARTPAGGESEEDGDGRVSAMQAVLITLLVAGVALAAVGGWKLWRSHAAAKSGRPGSAGAPPGAQRWLQAGQSFLELWRAGGRDQPPTPTSRSTTRDGLGVVMNGMETGQGFRSAPAVPTAQAQEPDPWWRSYGGGTRSFPTPREQAAQRPVSPRNMLRQQRQPAPRQQRPSRASFA